MPIASRSSRLDPALVPPVPDLAFEHALWQAGVEHVAGIDEAGRGALAGPVAAAAVILPPSANLDKRLAGVRDSKQMTAKQRQFWAERIYEQALTFAVGMASACEIDALGIVPATRLAVQRALDALILPPEHALLDYLLLPENPLSQTALIKGDCRSLSIAAASILAKTRRDAQMISLESSFPGYGLAVHKGYGTARHRQAIQLLGLSPVHRRSFTLKGPIMKQEDAYE